MSEWTTKHPVNFTPDGDTTTQAIKKHDLELGQLLRLLNRTRKMDFGEEPPIDVEEGQLWFSSASKPYALNIFSNGAWHVFHSVGYVDVDAGGSLPSGAAEGCLFVVKAGGNFRLQVNIGGTFYPLLEFSKTGEDNKAIQLDDYGLVPASLVNVNPNGINPGSDFDLGIGERVRYCISGADTINLHVIAHDGDSGLYRLSVGVHNGSVGGNPYKWHPNGADIPSSSLKGIEQYYCVGYDEGLYQMLSSDKGLWFGTGSVSLCTVYLSTRKYDSTLESICSCMVGDSWYFLRYVASIKDDSITINNLGQLRFPFDVDAFCILERLK